MTLVRRWRFILTSSTSRWNKSRCGIDVSQKLVSAVVLQDVPDGVCWRCKAAYRHGDHLVHVAFNSEDIVKPNEIYHYRCIPSPRWRVLAGSLPAWELPTDESPDKTGTSSAAVPTN